MARRNSNSKSKSSISRQIPAATPLQSARSLSNFNPTSQQEDAPSNFNPTIQQKDALSNFNPTSQQEVAPSNFNPTTMPFKYPVPLSQLDASSPKDRPWPIAGLLPAGLCVLSAKAHSGSLNLALQFALSIACHTPALGSFTPQAGHVLYLGLHDHEDSFTARTRHLLADKPLPSGIAFSDQWLPWDDGGLTALQDYLDDFPHTRLVVIDALSSLFPSDRPFNVLRKRALLSQLNRLAHAHHLTILLLHPQARHVSTDPFDAISCSPLLLDAFETLAVLEHDRSQELATLHLTGRTLQTHSLSLVLTGKLWCLDTSPAQTSLSPERLALLHAIEVAGHSLRPSEIATALNKESGTIRRLLFTMVRAGQVVQQDGRYLAPPATPPTPPLAQLPAPSTPDSLRESAAHSENAYSTLASSVTPDHSSSLPGFSSPIPANP